MTYGSRLYSATLLVPIRRPIGMAITTANANPTATDCSVLTMALGISGGVPGRPNQSS